MFSRAMLAEVGEEEVAWKGTSLPQRDVKQV